MNPLHNVDGEMVNMGTTLDGQSSREIPVIATDVYNRGLEYYRWCCWEEPDESIRPSIEQFTCVLEGKRCMSMYCDYSSFAPHDVRIAKSRRFEGLIVGADGLLCKREQKGPHDFHTHLECARTHECALLMAEMVSPPRIAAYSKKHIKYNHHYGACYPLWYQQEDRWRQEQWPEILRKEGNKYERRVSRGLWQDDSAEESWYNPDSPFDHLLYLSVHSEAANRWWTENFLWQADKILSKTKGMGEYIECDAPISRNREAHVITSFHQTLATARGGSAAPPTAPIISKAAKRSAPEWA